MPTEVWYELLETARRRDFKANEPLLREGARGSFLLALQEGRVAVLKSERLVALRGPGELVGEMAALDGSPRSAAVVALEPCVAYEIAADPFQRLLARHHAGNALSTYLAGKVRQSAGLATTRAEPPLWRTADLIVRVVDLAGPDHDVVPMSQSWIAGAFGLSRNAIGKAVHELYERGFLSDTNPIRVADLEGLRHLVT
ncbi:Crp/Fnr family transcriptional regulator [Lentzea sp. NBRC 105346]|uniref:Crp/Fnr family transcriptional regulator n=1 Tax=Lentzea sp. NBRC 105346 TaxID=3032205 RepID=UPI00255220E8|nr:Crp/Fnr family transcriptional regulator [Lentzea sp. NBRC 105346]